MDMERQFGKSLAEINQDKIRRARELLDVKPPKYNPGRVLSEREVEAIYLEAEMGRWTPEFVYNESNQAIGYRPRSIDANNE